MALGEIEMDVLLVIAVRAGAEHRGKARAGARPDCLAPILGDIHIGQSDRLAVGELERAHVERVGAAVLAQRGGAHAIAAAAFIGIEIVEPAQRRAERRQRRGDVVADPTGDLFGHRAAQDRRRVDHDPGLVGKRDRLQLHGVGGAAVARPDQHRQRLERREFGKPQLAGRRARRRRGGGGVRQRRIGLLRRGKLLRNDDRQRPRDARRAMLGFGPLRRRHGTILRRRAAGRADERGDDDNTPHADML